MRGLRAAIVAWALAIAPTLGAARAADAQAPEFDRPMPPPIAPTVDAPTGAGALAFDSLRAGMLVRLSARGLLHRRMGLVESRFEDTLLVRGVIERELVRVPAARIEWIQVSTGKGTSSAGLLTGGVVGLAAGVGLAVLLQHMNDSDGSSQGPCPASSGLLECGVSPALLVSSAAIGAALGMVVAVHRPGHRWRDVRVGR